MKKVFISGSRSIKFLNEEVVIWLDNLPLDTEILIGDASGCDKAVQNYLKKKDRKVTVYFVGDKPRNNAGFPTKNIFTALKPGRGYYTAKDKEMALDCDYGFIVWDGVSSGSYENMKTLVKMGKKSFVYKQRGFYVVKSEEDLQIIK